MMMPAPCQLPCIHSACNLSWRQRPDAIVQQHDGQADFGGQLKDADSDQGDEYRLQEVPGPGQRRQDRGRVTGVFEIRHVDFLR